MTTSIKNKMRKVMQLAHRAYQLKSSSMSWVECLKQDWQVVKLETAMKTKVVEFFFMKINGAYIDKNRKCIRYEVFFDKDVERIIGIHPIRK